MKLELIVAVVVLLFMALGVEGRSMWGSKRKRKEVEEETQEDDGEAFSQSFELKRRMDERQRSRQRSSGSVSSKGGSSAVSSSADAIIQAFDTYITMAEGVIESPQFESLINLESMKNIVQQIPGITENAQFDEVIQSLDQMDKGQLKATMQMGLQNLKSYFRELTEIANDPNKLQEALDQLPAEGRPIMEGLLKGDLSPLSSRILNEPSIDPTIKRILVALLDGDIAGAVEAAKEYIIANPEITETARKNMLTSPEMIEMLGFPQEVLTDKRKWLSSILDALDMIATLYSTPGAGNKGFSDQLDIDFDGETAKSEKHRFAAA